MTVYRLVSCVQPTNGPYTASQIPFLENEVKIIEEMRNCHNDDWRGRPGWMMHYDDDCFKNFYDRNRWQKHKMVAGCVSLDQLKWWFGPWFQQLLDIGFEILICEVPKHKVFVLENQCVFIWDQPQ